MNDEERTRLDDWVARLGVALKLDDFAPDIDDILDLAGVAARTVVRPAAPVTTFLVGYAAGLAAAAGTDPQKAVLAATATAEELAGAD